MKQAPPDHVPGVYKAFPPTEAEMPLIFDSPHSGRDYPADFNHACPRDILEQAEDNHVDELIDAAPRYGCDLLTALFPRTYIDVNRAEDDIDTELLSERWPGPLNPSARSYAGIGLIRRIVKPGHPVYNHPLSVDEVQHRLNTYYHPYHAKLKSMIDRAHYNFGQVWHIDCHSMPAARAGVPHGITNLQPDFVLGDRDGTSCDPEFTYMLRDRLRDMGYRVTINHPYKGVEIVRRSAQPGMGRHAIQMEISKALYWDESKGLKNKNFNVLKKNLKILIADSVAYASSKLVSLAADE